MTNVTCLRCGETGAQLAAPPLPKELGNRIYDSICQNCWNQWLQQQTAVINHYTPNFGAFNRTLNRGTVYLILNTAEVIAYSIGGQCT